MFFLRPHVPRGRSTSINFLPPNHRDESKEHEEKFPDISPYQLTRQKPLNTKHTPKKPVKILKAPSAKTTYCQPLETKGSMSLPTSMASLALLAKMKKAQANSNRLWRTWAQSIVAAAERRPAG